MKVILAFSAIAVATTLFAFVPSRAQDPSAQAAPELALIAGSGRLEPDWTSGQNQQGDQTSVQLGETVAALGRAAALLVGEEMQGQNQLQTQEPPTQPTAQLALMSYRNEAKSDWISVQGQVKNISGAGIGNLEAIVSWFSQDGALVSSEHSLIEQRFSLPPNEVSEFTVWVRRQPNMDKYTLGFKVLDGPPIAFIDRASNSLNESPVLSVKAPFAAGRSGDLNGTIGGITPPSDSGKVVPVREPITRQQVSSQTQLPDHLTEDELIAAESSNPHEGFVYIRQRDFFGSECPAQWPAETIYTPTGLIRVLSNSARRQYRKFEPTPEDTLRALTIISDGCALGTDSGPACESITRAALLSDTTGSVVVEAVVNHPITTTWHNGFGASAVCSSLMSKFMLSDVHKVQNKNGEFLVATFSGAQPRKTYVVKEKFLKTLGM